MINNDARRGKNPDYDDGYKHGMNDAKAIIDLGLGLLWHNKTQAEVAMLYETLSEDNKKQAMTYLLFLLSNKSQPISKTEIMKLKSIEELELCMRPLNVLKMAGIKTLGDIDKIKPRKYLLRYRGMGKKGFEEITEKMKEVGLW